MAKTTLKSFLSFSHIDASIVRAVVKQVGGWQAFQEIASDVANYGANAGWVGFTYYTDTVAFTKRHKQAIIAFAEQEADSFSEDGIISFLSGFNCLKGETQNDIADGLHNPKSDNRTTVYNALAWYCLEEVARSFDSFNN